jgi:predicted transcriptional regulator
MELIEFVSDLVKAQASQSTLAADDLADALKKVYKALKWVESQETKASQATEEPKMSGPESIQRNKVVCLECGKEFKQISAKHLAGHGTDRRAYKEKYGIALGQALSARTLSARRRKTAKELGLGEKLQAGKKKAKAKAKEKELGQKQAQAKTKGKGKKRQRRAPAAAPKK